MRIALITMVYNEPVFLPVWLNHYGPKFGYENLYVIDDGSTDDCTKDSRIVNLIGKNKSPLDEDDRAALISIFHGKLLNYYDIVIYTDVDEIIVVDPQTNTTLSEYLSALDFDHKCPTGWNVLHRVGREPPLDLHTPLFRQRYFVQCDLFYCKQLISKIPIAWEAGFHFSNLTPVIDTNLLLFHLRAVDLDIAKKRITALRALSFSSNSKKKNQDFQFRLTVERYIKQYFSTSDREFEAAHSGVEFASPMLKMSTPAELRRGGKLAVNNIARVPDRFRDSVMLNSGDTAVAPACGILSAYEIKDMFESSMDIMIAGSRRWEAKTGWWRLFLNRTRHWNEMCPCGSAKAFRECHAIARHPNARKTTDGVDRYPPP